MLFDLGTTARDGSIIADEDRRLNEVGLDEREG